MKVDAPPVAGITPISRPAEYAIKAFLGILTARSGVCTAVGVFEPVKLGVAVTLVVVIAVALMGNDVCSIVLFCDGVLQDAMASKAIAMSILLSIKSP